MPKGIAARRLAVLAALLALALVWAYWAAHPGKDRPSKGSQAFALWALDASDVKQIRVHLEKAKVRMSPEGAAAQDGTPYLWVTADLPEKPAAAPPAKAEGEQATAEAASAEERNLQFKGNKSAVTAFQSLTTLMAERRLGSLADVQGEVYGLPSDKEYIEIETAKGDAPLRINLGGTTFGDTYRYVHFTRDDGVYLIKQSVVQTLARAPARMMDRDLFPFPVPQSERIELRSGDRAVSFWRLDAAEGEDVEWGEAPDSAEGVAAVQQLVKDLARVKATKFLAEDAPAPQADLEVRLSAEGQDPATLRLYKRADGEWLAVSSHSRRAVQPGAKPAQAVVDAAAALLQGR